MEKGLKGMLLIAITVGLAASLHAADRKIAKSELPAAVRKAADQQSQGATVTGYSSEKENGKLEYEVQMTFNGHSKDVTIAPDGAVLEVEEQVAMGDLSTDVQAGLKTKAGTGKIAKIESLTKGGKIVAYEAKVMKDGKRSEIQVGPDGKALDHEE
jgi:uncharacterized membrane protein YkoI